MTPFLSSRARGGLLVLALALVGGPGCALILHVAQAGQDAKDAVHSVQRNARMAWLKPRADKGDPAALAELGGIMLSMADQGTPDEQRGLELLSSGADKGDARGQAVLAEWSLYHEPNNPSVVARSIPMLQRAATQACRFKRYGITSKGPISPYHTLVHFLERTERMDEARLWEARGVMHCKEPDAQLLARQASVDGSRWSKPLPALALLLLTDSPADIKAGTAGHDPALLEAARREAARLRELVARSEYDYPAPTRQELP